MASRIRVRSVREPDFTRTYASILDRTQDEARAAVQWAAAEAYQKLTDPGRAARSDPPGYSAKRRKHYPLDPNSETLNSIEWREDRYAGEPAFRVEAKGAAFWTNYGRPPGKMPPEAAIENWIQERGIDDGQSSRDTKDMIWLLRKRIGEEGMAPTYFMTDTITEMKDKLRRGEFKPAPAKRGRRKR